MDYIVVTEHQISRLDANELTYEEAAIIRQRYSSHIEIEYPSPSNEEKWVLRPKGKVGVLPIWRERGIYIQPKGPVQNIFRMLDTIGRLPDMPEGLATNEPVADIVQQLIRVLASQVQRRVRRGLHKQYVSQERNLPYVRGRIKVQDHIRAPHRTDFPCRFDEQKTDTIANQILAWTLYKVLRSGICEKKTQPAVRSALQSLSGLVSLHPMRPEVCLKQTYNRLTYDYKPMHGACYFLLQHMGLSHRPGNQDTIPFIVDMPRVFEEYAVEVLRRSIASQGHVRPKVTHSHGMGLFEIDAVVYDRHLDAAAMVMEVKYKYSSTPASEDVQQAVAYATALGCSHAVLMYPDSEIAGCTARIGGVNVYTKSIPLTRGLHNTPTVKLPVGLSIS